MGKSILLLLIGFVIGVAVTSMIRRDSAGSRAPSSAAPKAPEVAGPTFTPPIEQPKDAASETAAETPKSVAPAEPKDREPSRVVIPEAGRVRYGRPPKPKVEDVLKAATWDEFYKLCRERRISGETYEELILRRVSQDLGLDAERSDALRKLFKAEQEAATKAIVEGAGGIANFERQQEEGLGPAGKLRHDEWRRQRNVVRDSYNAEYLKVLTYDKLNYFNEHLRNTEIELFNSYSTDADYHLIGGVGRSK